MVVPSSLGSSNSGPGIPTRDDVPVSTLVGVALCPRSLNSGPGMLFENWATWLV
jgi:hypothetical protein